MNEYRYILEPYKGISSRHTCPKCKIAGTFSRYIDIETGRQISNHVGRCNREIKCGYHYTPKQYFHDNGYLFDNYNYKENNKTMTAVITPIKPISSISVDVFKQSLVDYKQNYFITYLIRLFGAEITGQLVSRYFIGTSNHWDGATIFWQIDISGNVRTGKIMVYDAITGRRIKEPHQHITWVHKAIKQPDFNLQQCLFGEHLIRDCNQPIALVESEKTAIISSQYLPQFIWLAVGSLNNLSADRCKVLKGKKVMLFPDLNCFDRWSIKARQISNIAHITVSDLLERKATEIERKQGLDLADYLTRFDLKEFNRNEYLNEVKEYWQYWPEAIQKFIADKSLRRSFFNEFCREYKLKNISYDLFEQLTLKN